MLAEHVFEHLHGIAKSFPVTDTECLFCGFQGRSCLWLSVRIDRNRGFGRQLFVRSINDADRLFEARLGRVLASEPGNPQSITSRTKGNTNMDISTLDHFI